jgi:hypothetical protein
VKNLIRAALLAAFTRIVASFAYETDPVIRITAKQLQVNLQQTIPGRSAVMVNLLAESRTRWVVRSSCRTIR